ncbi:MAG: class I SAM-dependent methyltransferase [Pseudomonadota bacterium]
MRLTQRAHRALEQHVSVGDVVVDATVGNGHDTVTLAALVGPSGHVFGFDIQQQAIDATARRVATAQFQERVTLLHQSHDTLITTLARAGVSSVKAVVFNLGYLPGSDKSVTTTTISTQNALDQSLSLIGESGLLCIMAYRGHPAGRIEFDMIEQWTAGLLRTSQWQCERNAANNDGPVLYCVSSGAANLR